MNQELVKGPQDWAAAHSVEIRSLNEALMLLLHKIDDAEMIACPLKVHLTRLCSVQSCEIAHFIYPDSIRSPSH